MRNIYDNSEFFAAYAEMGRSKDVTPLNSLAFETSEIPAT